MKTQFIIALLLFFSISSSQNIEKLKKADTIYIYFENDDLGNQIHHKNKTSNKELYYDTYFFIIEDLNSIEFTHHYRISRERKYVKKSFLKKNKDLIVNYSFLKKIGKLKSINLLFYESGKNKKLYIIEKNDIKRNKLLLKEVIASGMAPVYDE